MQISHVATTSAPAPPAAAATFSVAPASGFRPGTASPVALLDLHGVGFFTLSDTLTGYGRPGGYDSLANARRAAALLSRGAESPAAGVFARGDRYYVRALAAESARSPHVDPNAPAPPKTGPMLLHFEGNAEAHFAWVKDPSLVLIVDGSTKIFSRDAHHQPPA